jgi:hypothetical protein
MRSRWRSRWTRATMPPGRRSERATRAILGACLRGIRPSRRGEIR